jgi:hypothetical protein
VIRLQPTASLMLAFALLPARAAAFVYPVPVEVNSEREIWELFYNEDIDDVDRDRLLDLWDRGVDPNLAGRDQFFELPGVTRAMADALIAHRERRGPYEAPADLAAVLPEDVMIQARPFLRVGKSAPPQTTFVTGDARLLFTQGRTTRTNLPSGGGGEGDEDSLGAANRNPNGYLRVRAKLLQATGKKGRKRSTATAGVVASFRERLTDAKWDGTRYVSQRGRTIGPELDHAFAQINRRRWKALVGSYRLGFAQGLVFDDSGRRRPHGFYPNLQIHSTDDGKISPTEREFGLAAQRKRLDAGSGWLDATGFASFAIGPVGRRDLYQYRFTPHDIFVLAEEGGEDAKLASESLQDFHEEQIAGGNLTFRWSKRDHVGATFYTGESTADPDGDSGAVFASSSPYPVTGRYGSLGTDLALGVGWVDVELEGAMAFSEGPDGRVNSPAAVVTVSAEPLSSLEGTLDTWWYSADHINPHGSAVMASSEQYLGNRNRNQAGTRLRLQWRPRAAFSLRLDGSIWKHLEAKPETKLTAAEVGALEGSAPDCSMFTKSGDPRDPSRKCFDTTDMELAARADAKVSGHERFGMSANFHDEDIDNGGRDEDFDESGSKLTFGARFRTDRVPKTLLYLEASYKLFDSTLRDCIGETTVAEDGRLQCATDEASLVVTDERDADLWVAAKARVDLRPGPRIIGRIKWIDEGTVDSYDHLGREYPSEQRGETALDGYVQVEQVLWEDVKLSLRYRMVKLLDKKSDSQFARDTTIHRENPEHYVRALVDLDF